MRTESITVRPEYITVRIKSATLIVTDNSSHFADASCNHDNHIRCFSDEDNEHGEQSSSADKTPLQAAASDNKREVHVLRGGEQLREARAAAAGRAARARPQCEVQQ